MSIAKKIDLWYNILYLYCMDVDLGKPIEDKRRLIKKIDHVHGISNAAVTNDGFEF